MRLPLPNIYTAVTAVSLLIPLSAAAQSVPSPFEYLDRRQEIGPFSGYMSAGTGRFDYGPSGGTPLGVRYAIELTGPLALDGMVGVVDGTRNVVDPGRVEGDRVIGEADAFVTIIDAGFRFTFTGRRSWHDLAPFLSAGGGVAFDVAGSSELDDILLPEDVFDFGTSFFGTVGLGTRWFVTDRIAVRADAIFSLWKIGTPPGFSDVERGFEGVEDSEWIDGQTFTVALLYRW